MKNLNDTIDDLQNIFNKKIPDLAIPYVNGNIIRIKHMLIRPSKIHGYVIIDTDQNKTVATTFSKIAAIATVKAYIKGISYKKFIIFDGIIEKNYNDGQFYRYNINKTNNIHKKYALKSRFEISQQKIDVAKRALDDFILDNN